MQKIIGWVFALASLAGAQPARDQRLQQDLNALAAQLPALHVNAFHQTTQAQFNQAVNDLSARIPSISDQQFYVGLAAITAMIGDAHTNLYLLNDGYFQSMAAGQLGFLSFPIRLRWLDDGVFVEAAAPEYAGMLGMKLLKLGSTSVDDAVAALRTMISHENDQWVHFMAQHYLTSQQVLQAVGVLELGASAQLTFQARTGQQVTVSMSATAPRALVSYFDQTPGFTPDFVKAPAVNYWYTYFPSTRTLYFKYNACRDMPGLPFATFAKQLLATFDQNPVDTFVMDLRANTGGTDSLFNPLLQGLSTRLGVLLENPKFQFYGVIDKGTISAGMDDAEEIQLQRPGVDVSKFVHLIGEPSGGKPGSFGEVSSFVLPNSGLTVNYATAFVPAKGVPDEPALLPGIAIPMRSADFFARHDPVLAANLGRTTIPPAPSGDVIAVSAASFRVEQGLAAGSIAAAFGNFSNGADELRVNGKSAQLFAATTAAVVFLVPESTSMGPATISVLLKGFEVAHGSATITATSPGIFILDGFDPSQPGAVENPDYSVNSQMNPAHPGGFLQIYATGMNSSPLVYLGDVALEVLFSGTVGPGLWLVDAKIPEDFSYQGQVPLAIAAGGIVSNGSTVWISPK